MSSRPLRTASTGSLTGTGRAEGSSTDPGPSVKSTTSPTKASLESADEGSKEQPTPTKDLDNFQEESFRSVEEEPGVEDIGLRFRINAQSQS